MRLVITRVKSFIPNNYHKNQKSTLFAFLEQKICAIRGKIWNWSWISNGHVFASVGAFIWINECASLSMRGYFNNFLKVHQFSWLVSKRCFTKNNLRLRLFENAQIPERWKGFLIHYTFFLFLLIILRLYSKSMNSVNA